MMFAAGGLVGAAGSSSRGAKAVQEETDRALALRLQEQFNEETSRGRSNGPVFDPGDGGHRAKAQYTGRRVVLPPPCTLYATPSSSGNGGTLGATVAVPLTPLPVLPPGIHYPEHPEFTYTGFAEPMQTDRPGLFYIPPGGQERDTPPTSTDTRECWFCSIS